eukprot:178768-Rhodomonas_salina.2
MKGAKKREREESGKMGNINGGKESKKKKESVVEDAGSEEKKKGSLGWLLGSEVPPHSAMRPARCDACY